ACIMGQLRRGRHDDDCRERSPADVTESEEAHDHERPEQQARDGPRAAEDLDNLLADESGDAGQELQESLAVSAPSIGCSRDRSTRAAKTSSNDGRNSRTNPTLPPSLSIFCTSPGVATPAFSVTARDWLGPRWRTSRTARRPISRVPSKTSAVWISTTSPPNAACRSPSGLDRATSRPSEIRTTWSHSSASATYWVVTMLVRPISRSLCSPDQTDTRRRGSSPAVGPSRTIRAGPFTREQASPSRRCIPPES